MSKTFLCLSGWAQKHDSLEIVFTNSSIKNIYKINSLDYSKTNSVDELFVELKKNTDCEIAMGWSLGGQILVRAIANNIISPKLLILLASPFQMLKDSRINSGMSQELYKKINIMLDNNSGDMLKEFLTLISMNDRNAKEIIRNLAVDEKNFEQIKFWYEELCRFSCFDLDMSKMPPILYFHGSGDVVVNIAQKEYFQKYCPNFKSIIFDKCGHAPHLSRLNEVRQAIEDEIKRLEL
jgi:pimeloyl-[acyl-carrier protein] methyl ester esterase